MSIEQALRVNLEAAAEALVVPPAPQTPPARALPAWRRPLVFAATGALAALVLAVPIFLMTPPSGGDPRQPSDTFSAPVTTSPTTTVPTTVAPMFTGSTGDEGIVIGELDAATYQYTIIAEPGAEPEAPTATATLVVDSAGSEIARSVIGEPSAFFWHSISGQGGVCLLASWDDAGQDVVAAQVLLCPSLGCSDPYVFELSGETLETRPAEAADVARMFVEAWRQGSEAAIEILATQEAATQSAAIEPPSVATFQGCEGAAGSIYCSWQADDGEVVVRVSNVEPVPTVTEFTTG